MAYQTELPDQRRRTEARWPEGWRPPPTLTDAWPTADDLRRLLHANLITLMKDKEPSEDVAADLDSFVRRREPEEVAPARRGHSPKAWTM